MNFYAIKASGERRLKSTSGAAFQLVAQRFLNDGGVVFGAGFDGNLSVIYKKVTSAGELQDILGSKYVEASLDGVFNEVISCLAEGRKVLFVGTPCTINALRIYVLAKDSGSGKNLYLVDFICSGVPERGFWEAYLKFLEQSVRKRDAAEYVGLTGFTFRDKKRPDSAHTVSFEYDICRTGSDAVEHEREECGFMEDRYCRIYTKTISLQQKCFQCRWCSLDRPGDLTIGDYWGVEKYHPAIDDGYGVSLCIVSSAKGEELLGKIMPEAEVIELEETEIMQPRLSSPNKPSILNTLFRKDLFANGEAENCDIEMILKKYGI